MKRAFLIAILVITGCSSDRLATTDNTVRPEDRVGWWSDDDGAGKGPGSRLGSASMPNAASPMY